MEESHDHCCRKCGYEVESEEYKLEDSMTLGDFSAYIKNLVTRVTRTVFSSFN